MKILYAVGLATAAFIIGALMCRGDTSLARAELQRDSLKMVADSLQERDRLRSIADAFAADSTRKREAAIDSLAQLATRRRESNRLLRQRLDSLPGTMVPRVLVIQIIAGKDDEIAAAVASRESMRALLLTARRQKFEADTSLIRWKGVAAKLQVALDDALKHRRWGCVVGGGGTVGPAIAGARASLFGGSIGISATCGRKFL